MLHIIATIPWIFLSLPTGSFKKAVKSFSRSCKKCNFNVYETMEESEGNKIPNDVVELRRILQGSSKSSYERELK